MCDICYSCHVFILVSYSHEDNEFMENQREMTVLHSSLNHFCPENRESVQDFQCFDREEEE